MKLILVAIITLLHLTACHWGYGPLQDRSEFVSARLADDGHTVLFTFHRFAYRPAAGWRAFPDGGIPKYTTDINLLGTYDLQTRKIEILRREKNSQWQPGSGLFTIHSMNGDKALISQGGQLRGPFKLGVQYVLLDFKSRRATDLDLKADLASRGRDSGQIYLADRDGTLVFVSLSLDEAKDSGAYRNNRLVPEIWARTPSGDYLKAGVSAHYEVMQNGEIVYWELSTRTFMAFSPTSHATRRATEFKVAPYQDVTKGVTLSSDKKGLEFGVKVNDQWKNEPLDLEQSRLK